MIANPSDGSGYVSIKTVPTTLKSLVTQYPHCGGAAAWEYFNAKPGGSSDPIQWAVDMGQSMK